MISEVVKTLFNAESGTKTSEIIDSQKADTGVVEVNGTFTSGTIKVFGKSVMTNEFSELGVVALKDYTIISTGITANGIYEFAIDGISAIKIGMDSVSGGNVTVSVNLVR